MNSMESSPYTLLNIAIVYLEKKNYSKSKYYLDKINSRSLEQRAYLYFATYAEYEFSVNNTPTAVQYMDKAIDMTENKFEKTYLSKRKEKHLNSTRD